MKKVLFIAFALLLTMSLVFAAQSERNVSHKNRTEGNDSRNVRENQTENRGIGQNLSGQIREIKGELREGNYTGSLGQLLSVKQLSANLRELREGSISAKTDLNITAENDTDGKIKFKTKLKNGGEIEIKIMPNTASERALEVLRLKVCSADNNCTIQLKNVGSGKDEKVDYEIQIQRHSKILGIFSKKMSVTTDVDAGTGDVKVKKPWWAFLATEPAE